MIKRLIAGAVLTGAIPAFAADNLVSDGSFESVTLPDGGYATYTGGALPDWIAMPGDSIEVRHDIVGTAQDGVNFVELDSTHNSSMVTTITTKANDVYTLSFYYSNRAASSLNGSFAGGVVPADSNGLSYDVGAGAVAVPALAANTTSDNLWTLYTTTFTATSDSTTLMFSATGTDDSYGSSLDDIVVTAVPEPTTLAMIIAGVIGFAGMSARRGRGRDE